MCFDPERIVVIWQPEDPLMGLRRGSAGRLQQRVVEIPSPGSLTGAAEQFDSRRLPRLRAARDVAQRHVRHDPYGGARRGCERLRERQIARALRPKQRRAVPDYDTLTGLPARRGIKFIVSQQVDGTGGVMWREHHPEAGGQQQDGVADRDSRFGPSLRCRARWVRHPGRVNQSWVERGSCLPSPPGCPGSRG